MFDLGTQAFQVVFLQFESARGLGLLQSDIVELTTAEFLELPAFGCQGIRGFLFEPFDLPQAGSSQVLQFAFGFPGQMFLLATLLLETLSFPFVLLAFFLHSPRLFVQLLLLTFRGRFLFLQLCFARGQIELCLFDPAGKTRLPFRHFEVLLLQHLLAMIEFSQPNSQFFEDSAGIRQQGILSLAGGMGGQRAGGNSGGFRDRHGAAIRNVPWCVLPGSIARSSD